MKTIVRLIVSWADGPAPEDAAALLPASPNRLWRKGDPTIDDSRCLIRRKANGVEFHSGLGETDSLDSHLRALAELTRSQLTALKSLIANLEAEPMVSCVIYFDPEVHGMPAVHFEPWQLEVFASVGASIDVDLIATESGEQG